MAEEVIVLKYTLDGKDAAQKVQRDITTALNAGAVTARQAGQKIGQELGAGIEAGRNRPQAEQREQAHARRIEAIQTQSNARILEIQKRRDAQLDTIRERALQKEIEHQRKLEREAQRGANNINSAKAALTGLQGAFGALAALGVVNFFQNFANRAIDAAVAVDRQVNSLRALTGSAERATQRFRELVAIAAQTPGLTSGLATTLDAQLRVFNVSQSTINRLLPVVGGLNAISPLGDPRQFVNNLTQLISQNFERQDLKELVGQSPLAGRLIAEIFNVDNPTNAEAIRRSAKKLGVTTVERLAEELARAAQNNSALRNVTESLAGQFEKMQDRITLALAPIGDELLKTILPTTQKLVDLVEETAPKITSIIQTHQSELAKTANTVLILADYFSRYVGWISEAEKKFGLLQNRFEVAFPILSGIADIINRIDRFANRPDPNNPLGARGGGTGRAVIVGDLSGLPNNRDSLLFPGGGGGSPGIVNSRGQITDIRGRVIGRVDRRGGGSGGASSGSRARGVTFPGLTADDLVTSQFEGQADPAALINNAARITNNIRQGIIQAIEQQDRLREEQDRARQAAITELQRVSRRSLNHSGALIGDAVNRGQLTPEQAEAASQAANREYAQRLREILALEEQRGKLSTDRRDDLTDEINLYDRLGTAISNSERFMRGFNSATISLGDAFERFGQNVSQALLNTRDLLNGLKNAVLGFFNDLLGRSLQNIVGQALAPLAGILGGQQSGGGIFGNIFRTPTFSGSASSSALQSLAGIGFGTGFGIDVPASVSASLPIFGGNITNPNAIANASGGILSTATSSAARSGFSLSGIGSSLASAAPLLGLSLGSSLGGQSTFGKILGAAGGGAVGLGVSFGASVFGAAGGGLGALGPAALAALGPAALIGAPLLIGAIFAGKAAQRRKDEEASGQYLTQAVQAIEQLAAGVRSGQIDVSQARQIFDSQILGTFRQQISGLQTKSVRESRLTNQVRDLQKMYSDLVEPAIAAQIQQRRDAARFSAIDSRLIPQFASGGYVGGIDRGFDSVRALLRPGELVLNRAQQSAVMAQSNPNVFRNAGVPAVNTSGRFDTGGYAPMSSSGGRAAGAINIYLDAVVDAEGIVVRGVTDSRSGEDAIVNVFQRARKRKRSV